MREGRKEPDGITNRRRGRRMVRGERNYLEKRSVHGLKNNEMNVLRSSTVIVDIDVLH